jgi:hypothetical protein
MRTGMGKERPGRVGPWAARACGHRGNGTGAGAARHNATCWTGDV